MPLLVVPVAPAETNLLTLGEWDSLIASRKVFFERADHPLIERLVAAGVNVGSFDDEPDAGWSDMVLVADPASPRVVELARAGADVSSGPALAPDNLSAAIAAPLVRRAASALADLAVVMARLRSDDGCPWDREQDHESLKVHLLEEAYEVIDAIDREQTGEDLEEELGDVLLQVAFHARMAEQGGRFDLADVATGIVNKLVNRHPHVFGDVAVSGPGEVLENWEAIKATEKRRTDPYEGIPAALPALLAAYKTQKRAAGLGFETDEDGARERIDAALAAPLEADGLGQALFWLVALARVRGLDPEDALRRATARFRSTP
ncbi:MAG: nucleoside triphosphate pyrophosphohydrolase [Actinomycetota bacterium]|nr:nucleoside triphosphate pyrophosphohydrolase [Actinomycetota bacterium]